MDITSRQSRSSEWSSGKKSDGLRDCSVGDYEPTCLRRPRGRPRRYHTPRRQSQNKNLLIDGSAATNLKALVLHTIYVGAGEDIKRKVEEFARGKQSIVVLSGLGTVSDVNIEIPNYGFSERHQGSYPILSLNGNYTQNDEDEDDDDDDDETNLVGCLKVTLSCPDGCVRGGEVGETMIAETQVQVLVGSSQIRVPNIKTNTNVASNSTTDDVYIPAKLPTPESS